jgi:hypothetical protein
MPGPGQAEPDVLPYLKFKLDNVVALSPPPNPTTIVQAGQPVQLQVDLGVEGFWAGLLIGESFTVVHHTEREEDGARSTLPGGAFTVPTPPDTASFSVTTGPFSTGNAGSGANFEVPAGFDAGTFEILTHIHFQDPAKEPIVAGFHQIYMMVT